MRGVFLADLCSEGTTILYPRAGAGIVEFMGDAAGENTDSLHLLGLVQLRLKYLFFFFRLHAVGYIQTLNKNKGNTFLTIQYRRTVISRTI